MSLMRTALAALNAVIVGTANQSRPAAADRRAAYDTFDAYYHNTVYGSTGDGGQRAAINVALGNAAAADLSGLYNPVASVVDFYQHIYGGAFRPSDAPADEDSETDIRAEPGRDAAPELLPALDAIWKWSNLTTAKQEICRLPAMHGTAGLRIVAEDHPDPARRRVYLKPEHPRIIRDVELDARGNVAAIQLEYEITIGLGDDQQIVAIREEMDKERIATYRDTGANLIPYDLTTRTDHGPASVYANRLGVVPYVLIQHQSTGGAFGLNAFYRAREPIDRLNAMLTHLDTQIIDHVKVDWFIAADGPPPTKFALDGRSVIYVDTSRSVSGQAPTITPMVAPLSLADAISKTRLQIELIEDGLPELKATAGRFLSGQSGETIAQLRAPAEARLALARANYDDALVRASQIAVSWGILLDLWNLGTGQGTPEAAEAAYRQGREDFHLNERALLPPVSTSARKPAAAQPTPMPPLAPPSPTGGPTAAVPGEMPDDDRSERA